MTAWLAIFGGLWLCSLAWLAKDEEARCAPHALWLIAKDKSDLWPASFYWFFGWRLMTLVGIQIGLLVVAVRSVSEGASLVVQIGIGLCAALAIAVQHPRLHPLLAWERRRKVRSACGSLEPTVRQLEQCEALDGLAVDELTEAATYPTQRGWLARHPRDSCHWPRRESCPWAYGIVPIVYVLPETGSMVFPIDFETFVAWKLPGELLRRGEELPFEGPSGSSFQLRRTAKVRGCPNWTLLRTEIDFGDVGELFPSDVNEVHDSTAILR